MGTGDHDKFALFINHVGNIIDSKVNVSYHGQDYNKLALMYRFEFLTAEAVSQLLGVAVFYCYWSLPVLPVFIGNRNK